MKITLIIIQILLFLNIINGQDCDYDFETGTVSCFPVDLIRSAEQKAKSENAIAKLKTCLNDTSERNERYWYLNTIANNYNYLSEIDSTLKYTLLAFELDTIMFCREYINIYVFDVEDFPIEKHYMDSLDNKEFVKICTYCQDHFLKQKLEAIANRKEKIKREAEIEPENKEYANALKLIGAKDQNDRTFLPGTNRLSPHQNSLDAANRVSLDSLFLLYGFPSAAQVKQDGVKSAWFVLQHSTDCQWNEKWIGRFLDAYKENQINAGLLSHTIERFYKPVDGYCRTEDESGVAAFIQMLKEKYPKDFAEKFRYSKY